MRGWDTLKGEQGLPTPGGSVPSLNKVAYEPVCFFEHEWWTMTRMLGMKLDDEHGASRQWNRLNDVSSYSACVSARQPGLSRGISKLSCCLGQISNKTYNKQQIISNKTWYNKQKRRSNRASARSTVRNASAALQLSNQLKENHDLFNIYSPTWTQIRT